MRFFYKDIKGKGFDHYVSVLHQKMGDKYTHKIVREEVYGPAIKTEAGFFNGDELVVVLSYKKDFAMIEVIVDTYSQDEGNEIVNKLDSIECFKKCQRPYPALYCCKKCAESENIHDS